MLIPKPVQAIPAGWSEGPKAILFLLLRNLCIDAKALNLVKIYIDRIDTLFYLRYDGTNNGTNHCSTNGAGQPAIVLNVLT